MKALGYTTGAISVKYIAYATLAGILGGLFGVTVGFQIFPRVIYQPYLIMYRLPPVRPIFRLEHAWPALTIAVFAIVVATFFAILKILRSRPAELMRPKPPLVGRSVPMEKVRFLWRRLSFFHKVTVRNLFRYGKRFIMTVLGIAGCTALILTGFGLRNAVNDIIDKQFAEILTHEYRVYVKNPVLDPDGAGSVRLLSGIRGVEGVCPVFAQTAVIRGTGEDELEVALVVPSDTARFENYYNLRERKSGRPIVLPPDGVVLSEKAARLLDLKAGDTLTVELDGLPVFEVKITAIAENYVEHYIYMSPEFADQTFEGPREYNVLLAKTDEEEGGARDRLASEILEKNEFSTLISYSKVKEQMHVIFKNMDALIYVLIGSAFALALIVLYNLTNINVKERIREIATLKVLGFYDPEVSAYVFRENAVLTVLGAGPGLLLGMLMHSSVTLSGEVDMIMFGRQIHPESFVAAFLITCGFSILIHGIMHFYLKKVKMVESLKSVE
jgi:putative ABC transport system permease protein